MRWPGSIRGRLMVGATVVLIAFVFVKGFGVDLARARGER